MAAPISEAESELNFATSWQWHCVCLLSSAYLKISNHFFSFDSEQGVEKKVGYRARLLVSIEECLERYKVSKKTRLLSK